VPPAAAAATKRHRAKHGGDFCSVQQTVRGPDHVHTNSSHGTDVPQADGTKTSRLRRRCFARRNGAQPSSFVAQARKSPHDRRRHDSYDKTVEISAPAATSPNDNPAVVRPIVPGAHVTLPLFLCTLYRRKFFFKQVKFGFLKFRVNLKNEFFGERFFRKKEVTQISLHEHADNRTHRAPARRRSDNCANSTPQTAVHTTRTGTARQRRRTGDI